MSQYSVDTAFSFGTECSIDCGLDGRNMGFQKTNRQKFIRDDKIRKRLVQGCIMASGTVLLEPHVFETNISQFRHKELDYYVTVTFAIYGSCITRLVLNENWSNDRSRPHCTPNSDKSGIHFFLNNFFWKSKTRQL